MSPIIDFYPTDFRIDLNGKKYAWQDVALLPFVDEDRLHGALSQVYPNLIVDEGEHAGSRMLAIIGIARLHIN